MRYLVTAEEMRRYDEYTTEEIGIPAAVLMERAALAAFWRIEEYGRSVKGERTALVLAGMGNNGGDGLALARLLSEAGYTVELWSVGDEERASGLWRQQKKILGRYPVHFGTKPSENEYTVLVDALFGVGLSRDVAGRYGDAVNAFNCLKGRKYALDLPSGIDSDTGRILGTAVRADETITFGFCKRGLVLDPGAELAGKVTVADIGIPELCFQVGKPGMFALDEETKVLYPGRDPRGNKGTFGKVLLIAGSRGMAGAAVLAARAAYRAGAGMVKVITPEENRCILQGAVPEALTGTEEELTESLAWADVIAVGPGLGRSGQALELLSQTLCHSGLPLLIDGDGLNLLAERKDLRRLLAEQGRQGRKIVLTPHPGELSRLVVRELPEIKADLCGSGCELAMELQAVVAAKDARTFVCGPGRPLCVNLSGNSGLATAGSGDVLAGIIAGLMAQGMGPFEAACAGVCIHGRAGDRVCSRIGEHACMAGDLLTFMD